MTTRLPDPIAEGLARGWYVRGGALGAAPSTIECDVAIIGSGAGAGITAELLSAAGDGERRRGSVRLDDARMARRS